MASVAQRAQAVSARAPHVVLLSLEPWDDVWRRNQYLTRELLAQELCSEVTFVEPAIRSRPPSPRQPLPGLTVVTPQLRIPRSAGGLVELGRRLRRTMLAGADVLWINDPTLGVHCLKAGQHAVYDVTDDWREFDFPGRVRRRIIRAEDRLAQRTTTIVCSEVLRQGWHERYAVNATVVNNGVDSAAWTEALPRQYDGPEPHVGYVGTLHQDRLDVPLLLQLADAEAIGTVHLIGPDALERSSREALQAHPKVLMHGPVSAAEVPAWTKGLAVLISPHRVTPFTLSLDAIKSHEYLASGRPVVATPTSGFQHIAEPGTEVVAPMDFVEAVARAATQSHSPTRRGVRDWRDRAGEFAAAAWRASV